MLSKISELLFNKGTGDNNEFPSDFTNKIFKYSKELEWSSVMSHSEGHISIGFAFVIKQEEGQEEERSQVVHIFHTGEIANEPLIQISSPVATLSDLGDKMDQDFMNELLKLNAGAANYKWAIEKIDEDEFLIASSDQLLNTIDVGELAAAVYAVASAADAMESRFGFDKY